MALNLLVLAAGLGTRLRPLTDFCPKPLLPIADSNGMRLQLESLQNLEVQYKFANAHHLAEQMEAWCQSTHEFDKIFVEGEILGTAGPLAQVYLAGYHDELLVVNGDVYHNMDLSSFVTAARASNCEVALLSHPNPDVNTLCVRDQKLLGLKNRFGETEGSWTTFTGISWYSPMALAKLKSDDFDIRSFWQSQIEEGLDVFVYEQTTSHFWIDMGSPKGYLDASQKRLSQIGKKLYSEVPLPFGVGVGKAAIHGCVEFKGTAFLDQCIILGGNKLNPLVIPDGAHLQNQIMAWDLKWEIPH